MASSPSSNAAAQAAIQIAARGAVRAGGRAPTSVRYYHDKGQQPRSPVRIIELARRPVRRRWPGSLARPAPVYLSQREPGVHDHRPGVALPDVDSARTVIVGDEQGYQQRLQPATFPAPVRTRGPSRAVTARRVPLTARLSATIRPPCASGLPHHPEQRDVVAFPAWSQQVLQEKIAATYGPASSAPRSRPYRARRLFRRPGQRRSSRHVARPSAAAPTPNLNIGTPLERASRAPGRPSWRSSASRCPCASSPARSF